MECSAKCSFTNLVKTLPLGYLVPSNRSVGRLKLSAQNISFPKSRLSKKTHASQELIQSQSDTKSLKKTLKEICGSKVPQEILDRAEEIGFVVPTDVQEQALPILLSGSDCILHAQTGSGKTLTYLLPVLATINRKRAAVQALIIVPTRELGMQVAKVARSLVSVSCKARTLPKNGHGSIMTLLDGGTLKRQTNWIRSEPPQVIVATLGSLCQMIDKGRLKLNAVNMLVIDEVDSIYRAATQAPLLRKLLTAYTSYRNRQTIFVSASVPQHRQFIQNCIQHKWTKNDVVHVHVHPLDPMPSRILHRYVVCKRDEKHDILLSLLRIDIPKSAIVFVNEQSMKSKKAGLIPTTRSLAEFLRTYSSQVFGRRLHEMLDVSVLEEAMDINERTFTLADTRKGSSLLIATDLVSRGLDLPKTSHIYNFDLPKSAIHYIHRAGRTGRKPFCDEQCTVTSLVTPEELFVLKQLENTLLFEFHEISVQADCFD